MQYVQLNLHETCPWYDWTIILDFKSRSVKSTYNLGPSPPAKALKHLTSLPSKLKGILRELIQLCFIKKNGQRKYKYLVLGRDISYFVKKKHHDSTKKFSETDIINMLEFLLCLVDMLFNRQLSCLWVQIVLLFSSTCSVICMRQTSYRGFSRKTKRS